MSGRGAQRSLPDFLSAGSYGRLRAAGSDFPELAERSPLAGSNYTSVLSAIYSTTSTAMQRYRTDHSDLVRSYTTKS